MNYPQNNCLCPNVNNYAHISGPKETCLGVCRTLVVGGTAHNLTRCLAACAGNPYCSSICAMFSTAAGIFGCDYICDQLVKKPGPQFWPFPGGHWPGKPGPHMV